MKMSSEAIADFLQENRIGVLGINREDRPPQLVPVWFLYDGKDIWLMSEKRVPKIANMRRDPRLSLCVHDSTFPYRAVVVYGTGTLTEENVPERRREIARHYLGEADGDAYVAQPRPRGVILIRLEPESFYSFDNGTGRTS